MLALPFPYKLLVGPLPSQNTLGDLIDAPYITPFIYKNALQKNSALYFPKKTINYPKPGYPMSQFLQQLPPAEQPDLILWCDHKSPLPPDLLDSPCPVVLLVFDWHDKYLALQRYIHLFDHVFADRPLVQKMKKQGFERISQWSPYSYPSQNNFDPNIKRHIDICFMGHFDDTLYAQSHYLKYLLPLSQKYKVALEKPHSHKDFSRLLNQSKIVFHHSIQGEINQGVYDAAAHGALLFIEESNQEVRSVLPEKEGCILYNKDNLENLLHYYLQHDLEREYIAKKGRQLLQDFTFKAHFEATLETIKDLNLIKKSQPTQAIPHQTLALSYLLLDQANLTLSRASALEWLVEHPVLPHSNQSVGYTNALAVAAFSSKQLKAPGLPPNTLRIMSQALENALAQNPNEPILMNNLAWFYLELKQWPQLIDLNTKLIPLLTQTNLPIQPEQSPYVLPMGKNQFYQDWQALWLKKAPLSELQSLLLWNHLMLMGDFSRQTQYYSRAIEIYNAAQGLKPNIYSTYLYKGYLQLQTKEIQAGLETIGKGLSIGLFDLQAWQLLWPLLALYPQSKEHLELKEKGHHLSQSISYFKDLNEILPT